MKKIKWIPKITALKSYVPDTKKKVFSPQDRGLSVAHLLTIQVHSLNLMFHQKEMEKFHQLVQLLSHYCFHYSYHILVTYFLLVQGAKQKIELLKKKKDTWQAIRKIRQNEEEFELYPEFITKAQDIYLKAHTTMVKCVSTILSMIFI